jgi:hypothetical protein
MHISNPLCVSVVVFHTHSLAHPPSHTLKTPLSLTHSHACMLEHHHRHVMRGSIKEEAIHAAPHTDYAIHLILIISLSLSSCSSSTRLLSPSPSHTLDASDCGKMILLTPKQIYEVRERERKKTLTCVMRTFFHVTHSLSSLLFYFTFKFVFVTNMCTQVSLGCSRKQ